MTIHEEIVQLQPGLGRYYAELKDPITIYVTIWNSNDRVIDYFRKCAEEYAQPLRKSDKHYIYYSVHANYHFPDVFEYIVALCKLFNKKHLEISEMLEKEQS